MFTEIDSNIKIFEEMFKDCGDLVKRKIPLSGTYIYSLFRRYERQGYDRKQGFRHPYA